MTLRLIKVGGSLLDWPELPGQLRSLLERTGVGPIVLLAGGGRLADAVRHYDRLWQLPGEQAHELAVATMGLTARLLAQIMDLPLVDGLEDPAGSAACVVLNPLPLLRAESQAPGTPLARDWSVTSDAIAARLAQLCGAAELWLLKSVDPPADAVTPEHLARAGIVDASFPKHVAGTRLRIVNLRAGDGRPPAAS